LGLSHALHAELRPQHIRVTAIVAGGMRTPFLLDRFPDTDPARLQDPLHVARVVRFVLCQPPETVLPEVMVLPVNESSWPCRVSPSAAEYRGRSRAGLGAARRSARR